MLQNDRSRTRQITSLQIATLLLLRTAHHQIYPHIGAESILDFLGITQKKVLPAFALARRHHLSSSHTVRLPPKTKCINHHIKIKEAGELLLIEGLHKISLVYDLTQKFCPNLILYYAVHNLLVFIMSQV